MTTLINAIVITTGMWRAALITPGGELPFHLQIEQSPTSFHFTIINGQEHMLLDDVSIKGDSVIVQFPVYESELRLKVVNERRLEGNFINLTRTTNSLIPMIADAGNFPRFINRTEKNLLNIAGKWSVTFKPGTSDSSYAVGRFEQQGNKVTGTFLTPSGDYQFLEGNSSGDSLLLSTFNGVFVYLFKASIADGKMNGIFYSGTHSQIPFTGYRDDNAKLPDATKLTTIKNSEDGFKLRFPDTDSMMVSLDDPQFRNKVVVIQIMGSWCPNCLEESMFLGPFYDRNKDRGFEIIGLSFEKTDDFNRAAANVKRFQKRLHINYPLLVASNRDKIRQTLPALENFIGFPTTIFLDKNHKVRKIHAGFSGAAAGEEYDIYKKDFESYIQSLIAE